MSAIYPVRHVGGCGEIAYYFTRRLQPGDAVTAQVVRWLDGTQPKPGDPALCGHCGKVTYFTPRDIRIEEPVDSGGAATDRRCPKCKGQLCQPLMRLSEAGDLYRSDMVRCAECGDARCWIQWEVPTLGATT